MVTHLTTNLPVTSLNRAERTGRLVFWYLWSYVTGTLDDTILIPEVFLTASFRRDLLMHFLDSYDI